MQQGQHFGRVYYLRLSENRRPSPPFATEVATGQARALRGPLLLPTRPRAEMGAKRQKYRQSNGGQPPSPLPVFLSFCDNRKAFVYF